MLIADSAGLAGDRDVETACAVCGARLSRRPKVRLAEFSLLECRSCRSWTFWPRKTAADQAALHDSAEYFSHPYFDLRRNISPRLRERCRETFARIARVINLETLRGLALLEVGCDTGAFLSCAAEEFGVRPIGIDVAERAVRAAWEAGIEAYRARVETAPEQLRDFPLILAIDLIEHVTAPGVFLRDLRRRLRPGGLIYLETPNIDSKVYRLGALLCKLSRGRPAAVFDRLFPPQHIQYFTKQSFAAMARNNGLEVASLETRTLRAEDIAAALPVRLGMRATQLLDRLVDSQILICAVLRRNEADLH